MLKNICFLLNVLYIFLCEGSIYFFTRDYSNFIDRLTSRLSSINILYVKIFQAFALNNSLIDDKTNNKLLKFTDNAPWSYSDMDLVRLFNMADKYNIQMTFKYEMPINSGMISLVYKGYMNNDRNKSVIIKMKRKNIQKQLDDAIDNLMFFMRLLSFIPIVNKYQLPEVINKNIEMIREQTDFVKEINNMELIRENCKNLKYVKIPNAFRNITEEFSDIIVMEYIDGMKINEINENDYEIFAKLVVKFGLVTTIMHGVTHGDLHSGNILFIKDLKDAKHTYKIGILDFGIIYSVGSEYKGLLFDVFTQLFEKPPRELVERAFKSGLIEPPGILQKIPKDDYNNIVSFGEEILKETIQTSKQANQIQIYKFLSKFKEYLSKDELINLGIKPSDDCVKSQMVLAMAHGVTLTLCKDDYITLMDKVINELFHTNLIL